MLKTNQDTQKWFGYPIAKEGPNVPLVRKEPKNPVLRGWLLVFCAWLISKFEFLQFAVWNNTGLDVLRTIKCLDEYLERWDPTVIPLPNESTTTFQSIVNDIDLEKVLASSQEEIPGRYRSIAEYHALYRSGQLTPLSVAQSLLPLIRRDLNPPGVHSVAFIDSHPDEILAAAKESTLRYKAGKPLSILDGVPTGIKDDSDVAGYRSTKGRKKNDALFSVAKESSWAVQQWQEAGVLIMGKLNMHEVGADTTNNNPNWGTPRNPHNDQYYPGGSSGGPAYAISAGLISFALGSDGGGSIRIPSSFCGIYGLKPSHNRVEYPGSTVTVNGPLAATMSDLEIAYRLLANPDPENPIGGLFNPSSPLESARPKVLGIYRDWFDWADPSVNTLCTKFVNYCENTLGYKVVPVTIPYCAEGQLAHVMTIASEMSSSARDLPSSRTNWLSGFNHANKITLAAAATTPVRDYRLAQKLRNLLMQHLAFLFKKYPGLIIVTPTTPLPGWEIEEGDLKHGVSDSNKTLRNMEYVWMANFTGLPGINCPVGYVDPKKGEGKIPVGIMGVTEWGGENSLIGWGKDAEAWLADHNGGGGRKIPKTWVDVVELAKERPHEGEETN